MRPDALLAMEGMKWANICRKGSCQAMRIKRQACAEIRRSDQKE